MSFLTAGYLSPNLHRLFMTRGKDDFVSKRRFILGSQTEVASLFLVLKQYTKQVFHSLGWHHDLMTLCPSPFTIHKKSKSPSPAYCAVRNSEQSYWEHAPSWDSWKRYFLIGFFRVTSLCRRSFYVGCCFYRATRPFPIRCKGKINRSLSLQTNQWGQG